jgi:uncharacterized protein (TIGR02145 family)
MYDPCPLGWRVPDGGKNGVWSKALGSSIDFTDGPWILYKNGMNFSGMFGDNETIWYPALGYRSSTGLKSVGDVGYYWTTTDNGKTAHTLFFSSTGKGKPSADFLRDSGLPIRCIKE